MKKAIILSGVKWNSTLQRHHMIAKWLVDFGYEVTFVDGIMSSSFSIKKLFNRFFNKTINSINNDSKNITIVNLNLINPHGGLFNIYNKYKIKKILPKISENYDIVISYIPVRTTMEILKNLKYKHLVYDCVRAFENWGGYPKNLSKIECKLCEKADKIFVDSYYLKEKFSKMGYENKLFQLLPHITDEELEIYSKNVTKEKIENLFYFGHVGPHIDLDLLKRLSSSGYKIHIAGSINANIDFEYINHGYFSDKNELAKVICENADAIIIPYKGNMDGVIPAKLMQSFSTRLPVFINSFFDSEYLKDFLFVYKDFNDILNQLQKYSYEETVIKTSKSFELVSKNTQKCQKDQLKEILCYFKTNISNLN